LPAVAFRTFKARFEEPLLSEGFDEIKQINFVPNFSKPEHEETFKTFLV
jgi:bifunctional polynucleotide phosphatase/kinase